MAAIQGNKDKNLVNICKDELRLNLTQLALHSGIPRPTLDGWLTKNKVSPLGQVTLKLLLDNKRLRDELELCSEFKKSILEMAEKIKV